MSGVIEIIQEHILTEILVVIWLLFLWKFYLSLRQRALMTRLDVRPDSLEGLMSKEFYEKARRYDLDQLNFSNFKDIYTNIFNTLFLLKFGYLYFWQWSVDLTKYVGLNHKDHILISAVCMMILNVYDFLLDLPLKIYYKFFLEQKHGFNKETPLFFVKDQMLKFVVTNLIVLPLLSAMIWIVENGGDYFFVYLWIFSVVVTLFMMIVYPEFIAPLFDKYTPLPEGDLKCKIEALAASINYPLYKLFIVEGSKRSSHSNAYLYGFYKHKRIVLFDTLVKEYCKQEEGQSEPRGCDTDEVIAVLGHELGHWKYSHTVKGFILTQVNFLLYTILYAKLHNYRPMFVAFGFHDIQPTFIGFIIVTTYILSPLSILTQFVSVIISRRFEFEADRFAKFLGHGDALKRSLIKIHKDNLGYPLYDKLYSGWHHTHPPLLERLEAIDKED